MTLVMLPRHAVKLKLVAIPVVKSNNSSVLQTASCCALALLSKIMVARVRE
jgi:hypothetical protein